MVETLLIIVVVLLLVNLFLSYRAQSRNAQNDWQPLLTSTQALDKGLTRLEGGLKEEVSRNRDEMSRNSKETREELNNSFHTLGESVSTRMTQMAEWQRNQLATFSAQLDSLTRTNEEKLGKLTETLGTKFDSIQAMMEVNAKGSRDELAAALKSFQDQFKSSISDFNELQRQKLDTLTAKQTELLQATEQRLEKMREVIEAKLKAIQEDNNEKLERMRQTVDEKLHKTLEERLGQSFQIVSERLEQVQRGLGEMQTVASGVGDLKRVLANVKTRGSLGEYRLEMILEQILAPEQYQKDVATKPESRENVEFAVKLPSKDTDNETIWLPIDSKFPQDRYQDLLDAYDKADAELVEAMIKELDKTIKSLAKDIRDKYINPPLTTDFAIMFLPFEGLYAEVVKRPALFETLLRDFKVNVCGPSTFAAFVHSLQMGFRTLAIQKRSSEVWSLLSAVKTEFGKFGGILDGVQKNLQSASDKINKASQKSTTIVRKLKSVEALPQQEVVKYMGEAYDLDVEEANQSLEPERSE
ncbi:MAG: DNA recombination protein RmuC [Acidobacteria bacterium]|nr:DNA recombination protein RmuC [Acidobacteriota bacterium]MBI3658815.1 DNA recombination protein RmuC [Acidobacteriota bacterium]